MTIHVHLYKCHFIICGGGSDGLCALNDSDGTPKNGTMVEITEENDPNDEDDSSDDEDEDWDDEDDEDDDFDDASPETDRTSKPRRGFLGLL